MEIEVTKIPKNKTVLIPVANENLKEVDFVTDIRIIKCGGRTFRVFDYFLQEKGEFHQRALFYFALGQDINRDSLWKAYPDSDKIFLFVCTELDTENQIKNEVKKKEEKKEKTIKEDDEIGAPKLDFS